MSPRPPTQPVLRRRADRPGADDWPALLATARELENPCNCCCRHCGARRHEGERGYCGATSSARVTKAFVTYGEEAFLNPASMLYFAHCDLRCAYCSNADAIRDDFTGGAPADPTVLAAAIDDAFRAGKITSLQILGGEPTCSLSSALAVIAGLRSAVPVVWNSNFCFTPAALALLDRVVDFYVADLKFGNDRCARELCDLDHYWPTVTANLRRVDPARLLVRHLPLGGHGDCCCKPVIDFLRRELPRVPVSFHQLIPDAAGRTRCLRDDEWHRLDQLVAQAGLKRLYADFCLRDDESAAHAFVSEIVIRKDGSVMVQDLSAPLRNLLRTLHDTN